MTADGSAARHEKIAESLTRPVRERIRALLIDDDAVDSRMIERLSRHSKQLDIAITSVRSIDDAPPLLAEQSFDIVFVDYWLGSGTSIGFISDLSRARHPPCVLLTTLDEPDIRRVAFRAGADAFLSKDEISSQAIESVTLAVLRKRALI